ncbi:MAG: YdcF family protein [Microgenomates group bacterium]
MELGLNTVKAITKFIFVEDKPQKADLIIVPGSSHPQLPQKAVSLYKEGFAPKILFTGGFNSKIRENECNFGKKIALKRGVPGKDIFCEKKSSNTKENALEAAKIVEKHKLPSRKIILISKPYHARRLKMTFAKFFPRSKLLIIPVKDKRKITSKNWWKSKEKIAKVMEEVQKIGEYYLKGDLSL